MARRNYSWVRTVLVALVLCAMLYGQCAALAAEHVSHHASDHCCLLCHIGVLPFLQTDSQVAATPVAPVAWLLAATDSELFRGTPPSSSLSRGPPLPL